MFAKLKHLLKGGHDNGSGYDEVSEKKTTKLGYFLLIIMFLFLVGVGQTVFSDLKNVFDYPVPPATCLSNLDTQSLSSYNAECGTQWYSHADNGVSYNCNCRFSPIDSKFGLDSTFEAIQPTLQQISNLNGQIQGYRSQIAEAERRIRAAERQYELGLQEKMAEEQVLYNRADQQAAITTQRNVIRRAEMQKDRLSAQRDTLIQNIAPQVQAIAVAYDRAVEHYKDQAAWHKFKVFGLMLLFVVPFFAVATRWYLKAKRSDSPYSIIATAVMAASAILLLQVVLMFLYRILPMEWLARLLELFLTVPLLRYIIYYAGVALVIAVFGGIVYFIQKRVFHPKRVAKRRLKQGECPRCSYHVHHSDRFCPSCALSLKEACERCGHDRSVHLAFCAHCGTPKPSTQKESDESSR